MFILAGDEGVEGAAEGVEKAVNNPVLPVVNEMFWGLVTFTALYLLVKFVLLPPFKRVMDDRKATIAADKDAADRARQSVAQADGAVEDQLAGARAEAAAIIEAARAEASAERQRLLARAEREVEAMHELAETEVAAAREKAMEGVQPQVAELAVGAASHVLNRQVDLANAQPVINRHLSNPN